VRAMVAGLIPRMKHGVNSPPWGYAQGTSRESGIVSGLEHFSRDGV